jgi:hypothetical protein
MLSRVAAMSVMSVMLSIGVQSSRLCGALAHSRWSYVGYVAHWRTVVNRTRAGSNRDQLTEPPSPPFAAPVKRLGNRGGLARFLHNANVGRRPARRITDRITRSARSASFARLCLTAFFAVSQHCQT